MGRGTHRGFITYEELNKSLGKRNLSDENLSQAFIHILDEGVALVEKKSDFKVLRKKEGSSKEEGKTIEKSDDPIRMYLREMGGVELLSREGEIAIAKRIEAGKDVMLIALSQSPMTAQQFYEWNDQLQKDEILVREIIDIDTNYMEDESTGPSAKQKNAGETDKEEGSSDGDDDDFNPTLAAMETEIKPKVLKTVNTLTKEYTKLIKYQKEKLDCVLNSQNFSPAKEKGYQKIVDDILENIKSLQLSPSVLEELVQKHYVENKKIISLEGNLLRLAIDHKISRNEFIKFYIGNEINPNFKIIPPLSYKNMLEYLISADLVITDSGGVQKESYFSKTKCITIRSETEWTELIDIGANILCKASKESILDAYNKMRKSNCDFTKKLYGNGNAALKIVENLQ